MLFSSFIFLCFFLPIAVGIYYILPYAFRNTFLLIASLIFYGWSDLNNLMVMFIVAGSVYFGAVCIDKVSDFFYSKNLLVVFLIFIIRPKPE
ncbi:MAG: MBOAT family protein, partial [Alphaproteobacteria bacterium]|nr:MBOAT family protein [Alphaproteobacteria bacterium]